MSLNEFDLINTYFKRPAKHSSIIKSIGDDCALLTVPEGYQLAVSMDTLVSGRHFPEEALPGEIAQRAFCTCLSDLASMGAEPRWFTLGLTLPASDKGWLAAFSEGLFELADEYDCELVGGDTTQGPLTISIQVHGVVPAGAALTRNAATVGDKVYVTGCVGDGAAALALLLKNIAVDTESTQYLRQRFYRPEPQIKAAELLRPYANAAIDISDGLVADLQHIAKASSVDIEIDTTKIPISPASLLISDQLSDTSALDFALVGGDDYQLAFTVPKKYEDDIQALIAQDVLKATAIGDIVKSKTAQPEVRCFAGDQLLDLSAKKGYQHFAS